MKFALRNFAGNPVRYFHVDAESIDTGTMSVAKSPTHHIAILDVSGSMYGDLDSVKSTVEKVFTLDEFNDPSQKITLITYASNGDCVVHFSRVTVAEVLTPNSPYLSQIRNLRTRGCTGISQALRVADTLVDDNDITCISLHTDGYANDPSPYAEGQALMDAADKLARHPNLFCNTIGYRHYCDFPLLGAIANKLSGVCQQASSAKDVYTALHGTQTLLAGNKAPTLEAGIGTYDLVAFVSNKARKVLGGTSSVTVRGLSVGDDATVYRFREITEAQYQSEDGSDWPQNIGALLAYARVQVALGNYNAAKYAMISTKIENLYRPHVKAMVANDIAAWTTDLERFMFDHLSCAFAAEYGLGETGPSVLSVLSALNLYRDGLRIDMPAFVATYKRRGVKKVAGHRDPNGVLVPASYRLSNRGGDALAPVSGVEINSDTATANIKIVQDADLVRTSDGQIIPEVAGVNLKLKSFRNYTVVSDGVVNTPVLPIRTSDKRLFAWLESQKLVPTGTTFDPNVTIQINLEGLPLVAYDQTFATMTADTVKHIVRLTVASKILNALNKGESESLTGEQITELKAHCLTPALYFSGPTTTPYTDLQTAIAAGEIDTRNSYKITVGTPDILNVGKLYSGNAYLQRRFTLEGSEKPTLPDFWEPGCKWGVKTLSSRTKIDAIDDLTYPLYAEFLGLESNGSWDAVLSGGLRDVPTSKDDRVAFFTNAAREVDQKLDAYYAISISPLAFYVGATGLVPDELNATAMNAEQLVAKYPQANPGKSEREGQFYELPGGVLLSVYTTIAYFSTERGVDAAKALSED